MFSLGIATMLLFPFYETYFPSPKRLGTDIKFVLCVSASKRSKPESPSSSGEPARAIHDNAAIAAEHNAHTDQHVQKYVSKFLNTRNFQGRTSYLL